MLSNRLHVEDEVDPGLADLDINLELALTLGLRLLEQLLEYFRRAEPLWDFEPLYLGEALRE